MMDLSGPESCGPKIRIGFYRENVIKYIEEPGRKVKLYLVRSSLVIIKIKICASECSKAY